MADDAATSTADRATPCRLSRELSSTSTAAGLTPAVPGSSALATYHHHRNAGTASDQSPPKIRTHRNTHAAPFAVPRLSRASPVGSEAEAALGTTERGPRAPHSRRAPGTRASARPPPTGPAAWPRSSAWCRPSFAPARGGRRGGTGGWLSPAPGYGSAATQGGRPRREEGWNVISRRNESEMPGWVVGVLFPLSFPWYSVYQGGLGGGAAYI